MIEVMPGLYVGSQRDFETEVGNLPGWRVVHACKEPYHRQALGYTGRAAPRDHPEYLVARRGNRLILNLVDADSPAFFSPFTFDAALEFIHEGLADGESVLVHCNQGESRGPGVAMLYLGAATDILPDEYPDAEVLYTVLYPPFRPSTGVREFLQQVWATYRRRLSRP